MADGEPRPTKASRAGGSDEVSESHTSPGLQRSETLPTTESQPAPMTDAHGTPEAREAAVRRVMVPRWIQLVALPLLVLAVWAVAVAAGPVLLIFAVAGVLALILNPVVRWIQRARVPRGRAVVLVYVGFWPIVATGAILLANLIADQIAAL